MRWSFKITRVKGIGIHVHATFLLLVGLLAVGGLAVGQTLGAALGGVAFLLAIFACVVLHELGHALAALRYGIRTRDITLLPIGGVARLERIPRDPRQELVVALAGPLVNVAIAAFLAAVLVFVSVPFLAQLMWVNIALVGFNLLPAFPMDGGRVLRALLAFRLPYARATRIAARAGKGMALLFGFVGLFFNPFLAFIALFVWFAASREARFVEAQAAFEGIPARRAMRTEFDVVRPDQSLGNVLERAFMQAQTDFPVVERDLLVGVLTQEDLVQALRDRGPDTRVAEVMRREPATADETETLDDIFQRLQGSAARTIAVLDRGRLVGLITLDTLGSFMRLLGSVRPAVAR